MFGLRRSSARIRARVRPVQPRAKRPSRRPRAPTSTGERGPRRQAGRTETTGRHRAEKSDDDAQHDGRASKAAPKKARGQVRSTSKSAQNGSHGGRTREESDSGDGSDLSVDDFASRGSSARRRPRSRGRGGRGQLAGGPEPMVEEASGGTGRGTGSSKEAEMSIEAQQQLARDFVSEVVARFGIDATTNVRLTEDDGIYISVDGRQPRASRRSQRAQPWRPSRS